MLHNCMCHKVIRPEAQKKVVGICMYAASITYKFCIIAGSLSVGLDISRISFSWGQAGARGHSRIHIRDKCGWLPGNRQDTSELPPFGSNHGPAFCVKLNRVPQEIFKNVKAVVMGVS